METLFISDLHLSPERPDKIDLFKRLLRGPAQQVEALYILGDLFENFWAGNDDRTPPGNDIINELTAFTRPGNKLYMVRGNRELMIDKGFETLTGCSLLPDGSVIDLAGEKILLMHGDRLCTRDTKYQCYRRFTEHPFIKGLYLWLPYRLRILLAHGLRPYMLKSAGSKLPQIIDVEQATVEHVMRTYGVHSLIHGHTHRPGIHAFQLDGQSAERIVLGDWYQEDSVLVCGNGEKKLMRVSEYIESQK